MKNRLFVILLAVLVPASSAFSSGYHPVFARAIVEAEIIVHGKVVEAWIPKLKASAGKDNRSFQSREGRVYRMKVIRCNKGKLKPDQEIIFRDPHYSSTAS